MRILIAEDDPVSRSVLERTLRSWGHEVVVTVDGNAAWTALQREDLPRLAILDWMMPVLDGSQICQRVRSDARLELTYLILLTAKGQKDDVAAGLDSGADDYIVKPFDRGELRSRIRAGERILTLQSRLADRVRELENAHSQIQQLSGLLPICSYCKSVRDDGNYWHQVESYLGSHADVQFSHGICPNCFDTVVKQQLTEAGISAEAVSYPS